MLIARAFGSDNHRPLPGLAPEHVAGRWLEGLSARAKLVLAALLFRISLDLCYVYYMNPVFAEHFLTPAPIDFKPLRYILSFALALLPATYLPSSKRDFSGIFFLIPMMFIYLPITSIFGLDAQRSIEPAVLANLAILISYVVVATRVSKGSIPLVRNGERIAVALSYAMVAYFIIYSVATGAIANINFDLSRMYEVRDANQEVLDVGVLSYLNLWAQKVCNPFLLTVGIQRKNKTMILVAVAMQIIFFAVTQHRDHLAAPVIVYLASQLYVRRLSIPGLLIVSSVLLTAVMAVSVAFQIDPLAELVVRRPFFVPSSLTYDWISFFSNQPKVYWSDGILGSFGHTRYSGQSVQWYIGYFVSGGTEVELNVGLVGTGFAQAGLFGIILYAAVLGVVVKIVNAMIHGGLPPFLPAALLFGPIGTAWGNTDLPTALLTHGVLISILLMWLYGSPAIRRRDWPVVAGSDAIASATLPPAGR